MKAQILQILQMQQAGKLTQEQAAELLAVLADRARENAPQLGEGEGETRGAPGPEAAGSESCGGGRGRRATAAIHDFVDTAVGVGSTVGRAATVIGGELLQMVHRQQDGNAITLSKVEPPGEGSVEFVFRDNAVNVSKVSHLVLRHAELSYNGINASQLAHITITRGRLNQCQISGSSVSHITLEGAAEAEGGSLQSTLRGVTFNATKFHRVRILGGSQIDAGTFQATSLKDLELVDKSSLRDSRVIDSAVSTVRLERSTAHNLTIERSSLQGVTLRGTTLEGCTFSCTRLSEVTLAESTLTNTRFRRDPLGSGVGGKDGCLQETTIERCTLTDCEFAGCTFRRTTLRNVNLSGVVVRNIDFTGRTIESDEAFRQAAGL